MRLGLVLLGMLVAAGGAGADGLQVGQAVPLPGSGADCQPNGCVFVGVRTNPTVALDPVNGSVESCPTGNDPDTDFGGLAVGVRVGTPGEEPDAFVGENTILCLDASQDGTVQLEQAGIAGGDAASPVPVSVLVGGARHLAVDASEPHVAFYAEHGAMPDLYAGALCAESGGSLATTGAYAAILHGDPIQAGGPCEAPQL